jgi:GT2 family glycosyltransferase
VADCARAVTHVHGGETRRADAIASPPMAATGGETNRTGDANAGKEAEPRATSIDAAQASAAGGEQAPSGADARPVAAIVLNWNGRDATDRCLASLLGSDYPALRVYCVDNGSTDDSLAYLMPRHPAVTFLPTGENLYYAGGNNVGLRRAIEDGAEYVLVLNNDTTVAPEMISVLARTLDQNPDVGMVGPKIYYLDRPDILWFAGGGVNFWQGRTWHIGLRQPDRPEFNVRRDVGYLTGCAIMTRRRVLEEVGLLDPAYVLYAEDADWCLRARRTGWRLLYVPEARMWHEVSLSSGGAQSPFKIYHKVRSNFRLFRRYARPYHWLTIPFAVAAGALVYAARALVGGNKAAIVALARGLWDALAGRTRRAMR